MPGSSGADGTVADQRTQRRVLRYPSADGHRLCLPQRAGLGPLVAVPDHSRGCLLTRGILRRPGRGNTTPIPRCSDAEASAPWNAQPYLPPHPGDQDTASERSQESQNSQPRAPRSDELTTCAVLAQNGASRGPFPGARRNSSWEKGLSSYPLFPAWRRVMRKLFLGPRCHRVRLGIGWVSPPGRPWQRSHDGRTRARARP